MRSIHSHRRSQSGFTMLDALFAAVAIGIVAMVSLQSLLTLNRNAAVNRMFTNARAVVQNDADTALSDAWPSSAYPTPASMAPVSNVVVPIDIRDDPRNGWGEITLVSGTLTRTTTPVLYQSGVTGVITYQITSSITYEYPTSGTNAPPGTGKGKMFTYKVVTMRSTDN